jgi:hypothetical protein
MAGSSLFLPHNRFRTLVLLTEAALPLAALFDRFVSKGSPLKRLSSPARTFLLMNAAALAAIAVFFVPANRLWTPTRVQNRPKPVE